MEIKSESGLNNLQNRLYSNMVWQTVTQNYRQQDKGLISLHQL